MSNTKKRHMEILRISRDVLIRNAIDISEPVGPLLPLAKEVSILADCHITTAKRNLAKAIRLMRGEIVREWGGKR